MNELNQAFIDSVKKNYPVNANKIIDAYKFADEAHRGVFRKSGEPYIVHPLAVAEILMENNMDYASIMAGLLHDVVEDTRFTRDDIKKRFGETVAKRALKDAGTTAAPQIMYMVGSPTEEEYYLKGITKVVGRVPLFGGSAADNTIEGKWSLYANNTVVPEGVAVAFIYTTANFANVFTGAYHETKDMGIITKVDGNRTLVEIDGTPALKQYAKWRKMSPKDLMGANLLSATITSPLGVKDRLGDLVAIRHPMNGNQDYSMNIGNKLATGTCVIRMEATVDELIASVSKTLTKLNKQLGKPAEFYHLVHCGGRRAGIGDRINEVYQGVKKVVGDTPFIMEFTFGEYGYVEDGRNTCGGLMLSFTAFSK